MYRTYCPSILWGASPPTNTSKLLCRNHHHNKIMYNIDQALLRCTRKIFEENNIPKVGASMLFIWSSLATVHVLVYIWRAKIVEIPRYRIQVKREKSKETWPSVGKGISVKIPPNQNRTGLSLAQSWGKRICSYSIRSENIPRSSVYCTAIVPPTISGLRRMSRKLIFLSTYV